MHGFTHLLKGYSISLCSKQEHFRDNLSGASRIDFCYSVSMPKRQHLKLPLSTLTANLHWLCKPQVKELLEAIYTYETHMWLIYLVVIIDQSSRSPITPRICQTSLYSGHSFTTGESVEENAYMVLRLLIRRPECFGPALQGDGGNGLLAAVREAIRISDDPSMDGPSSPLQSTRSMSVVNIWVIFMGHELAQWLQNI